ncbi:diguanylate phosphodiesterase [Methylobacterium sp. Leaf104]|uniref:EAL domain-containing protein n=1 Tax=Methylobacterium TaxID=407 RepID=UPI0006F44A5C|nr:MULTISPECIES: EAL domain-containing protein [Methylobacterium]KQP38569.1 diguanylate phosphodiesterase [Methylobacterium sp. Leaf104]MCI9879989.1 EAL domain-containing protein [Methylobacterium goesingense]
MARIVGRRTSLWALVLLGLCLLGPLAVFSPLGASLGLAGIGLAAALVAHRRAGRLNARCEKLSGEVDVLSQRLVRLETVTRALAEQQVRAVDAGTPAGAPAPAPGPDSRDLSAGIEEVTAEIGLLSGIVRELAAVVAAQDGEIAGLKAAPAPAPVAPPSAPPPRPAPRVVAPDPDLRAEPRFEAPPPRRADSAPAAPWTPRALSRADAPARDPERDAALIAAFDAAGLEVHLQPIVSLPQRKVVSYEAMARLRLAGETLMPEAFVPVLERHGRTTDLDRRMIQRVATIAQHLAGRGSQAAVAYGLSPRSLFEPGFLRSLGRLVEGVPDLSGRVMLALPQVSWRSLDAEQAGALADLRGRIGFILDRPLDLRLDPLALADRGVAQVKVPADLLLRPDSRQAMPDIALEDLVAALGRAGIRLVAERVERETDVPDLIELDVPLAQGSVFAPARVVRAEVLNAAPPAPEPGPPNEDPEPPPQRRPFRDFLRRAG